MDPKHLVYEMPIGILIVTNISSEARGKVCVRVCEKVCVMY